MRWLLRLLTGFFQWPLDDDTINAGMGDETRTTTEAGDRDRILGALQQSGGHRMVRRYRIGPPAAVDGVSWQEERVQYLDGLLQTDIEDHELRRCSCGAVLGGGHDVLLGVCSVCSAPLCSAEGCAGRCSYCGGLVCARHRVEIGGRTYCTRHRWAGYFQAFWEGVK